MAERVRMLVAAPILFLAAGGCGLVIGLDEPDIHADGGSDIAQDRDGETGDDPSVEDAGTEDAEVPDTDPDLPHDPPAEDTAAEDTAAEDIAAEEEPPVEEGLVVLYTFMEGDGGVVHDVSGVGEPLDLGIACTDCVSWLSSGGLSVDSSTVIFSAGAAEKVRDACTATSEITVEAWVAPAAGSPAVVGPLRIVTFSLDTAYRNFTLATGMAEEPASANYVARLRTTDTTENGMPELLSSAGTLTYELTHVVFTHAADGTDVIYLNGGAQAGGERTGDFSTWNAGYQLALANELTGDRTFSGISSAWPSTRGPSTRTRCSPTTTRGRDGPCRPKRGEEEP